MAPRLIQNPSACTVRPKDLLCRPGQSNDCLSADQLAVLNVYLKPLRDRRGNVVYPGWPIAHFVGLQGASYLTFGKISPDPSNPQMPWGADEKAAPRAWRLGTEALTYWLGYGSEATVQSADIDVNSKVVSGDLLARTRAITN